MIAFFPFLIVIFYLAIIFGILYLINSWVNKLFRLKQEQNDLLKEVVNKMGNR